ncbi:molybdenum cofactor biosynthesis protein [Clostridium sp. Sa3CUN1]|uniref:Molybdenum cofactor biosynthesis protein n=1 Tax=Clostridium gallinarum TaxID=2762246 RepID=A0ABR8Q3X7_9CLOT|nr:molybdopterin-binding protein [Clostridium gallinarum]MBD7915115.1 molybdenum cofactor biosynthesis protein [Clostridium gallinarum]
MRKAGILGISKDKKELLLNEESYSTKIIKKYLENEGYNVVVTKNIESKIETIEEELKNMSDDLNLELIFTVGGIYSYEEDVTPEATKNVIHRETSGISEGIRYFCLQMSKKIMLSRGIAGIRNKTLIVNLPETTKLIIPALDFSLEIIKSSIEMINKK